MIKKLGITIMTDEEIKPYLPEGVKVGDVTAITFQNDKPKTIHLTGFKKMELTEAKV